jgi:hypothetical protein
MIKNQKAGYFIHIDGSNPHRSVTGPQFLKDASHFFDKSCVLKSGDHKE